MFIKGSIFFLIYPILNFHKVTITQLLCVLWHILPWSFSKTYSHRLTVYTPAWITINLGSGEEFYGVPAVQALMLRFKVLFLWSRLWVSKPKGLPLLIKAIKYTPVLAGVKGFENHSPDWWRNALQRTERDTVSGSPLQSTGSSCLLTLHEPGAGRSPWEEKGSKPQRECCWCKCIKLHCLTDGGLVGKGFRQPAPKK